MIKSVLFVSCTVALALAGVPQPLEYRQAVDHPTENTHHEDVTSSTVDPANHENSGPTNDQSNHASGAQLSSLARSSALQAKSAVQSQNSAGHQAAFGAKSNLAQAAIGAAATAQAALIGKQIIFQELKYQLDDAQKQLETEISLFEHNKLAAHATQEAAEQSQQQLNALTAALAASQEGTTNAVKAAAEAAAAVAGQRVMIQQAKARIVKITKELNDALDGLEETKAAADRAAADAKVAQKNAAEAANAVSTSATAAGNH